jgi:ankyrin repeat protein
MNAGWENAINRGDVQDVRDLLDRAAHASNRKVVEALIAHRANLNITAKYGLNALMLALIAGHAEVARLLADAGADLSVRGTGAPGFAGKTAYDLAIERDMRELAAALKPKP